MVLLRPFALGDEGFVPDGPAFALGDPGPFAYPSSLYSPSVWRIIGGWSKLVGSPFWPSRSSLVVTLPLRSPKWQPSGR